MNNKLKIAFMIMGGLGISFLILVLIGYISNEIEYKRFEKELLEEYEDIEYVIPPEFSQNGSFQSYSFYEDSVFCRLEVNSSEIYEEDFEKWFKSSIITNLNKKVGELKEIEINGNKAFFIEVWSNDNPEHYYGIRSSKYYYNIEYSITNYGEEKLSSDHPCYLYEDKILSSIKIKE